MNKVDALRENLVLNKVADRCTVYPGDNAVVAPIGVADRVNLGLIPSSEKGRFNTYTGVGRDCNPLKISKRMNGIGVISFSEGVLRVLNVLSAKFFHPY